MSRKRIHINTETHAKLQAYCRSHGLTMTRFVEGLITKAVKR